MFKNLIDKILNKKSIEEKNKELIINCKCEFDKYQDEENYEIETIKEIYTHIYTVYVKKLKRGNLNIKLEKIRIEKSLAKHKKTSEKLDTASITLVIGIITIILNLIMDFLKSQLNSYHISKGWLFTLILIIFASVMRSIENENKKSRAYERDLVNYISLKVLNDIENGIIE
ncbi:hypothetical protein [Clostridium perfringens]|uniref:hypothetical protein n=1 Tax=Clostridium perfringens TaxID=1502 RepID=UPI0023F955C8|nr:hypothetical protein [Clostridium perfringens]WEV18644.1 hypothetical protein PL323_13620 [Clostridium perfringens D]